MRNPFFAFFTFVAWIVFGLLLGNLFGMLLAQMVTNLTVEELYTLPKIFRQHPEERVTMLLIQGGNLFVTFVVFPILYYFLFIATPKQEVQEHKLVEPYFSFAPVPRYWFFVFPLLITLLIQPFITLSGLLNQDIVLPEYFSTWQTWMLQKERELGQLTIFMTQFDSLGQFLIGLVVIALLPGVGEELCFRGILQPLFSQITKNHHVGIWITAILFSAVHLQFYGFFPRMFLGALFGYLYFYSQNLYFAMIAHFFNNALTLLLVYIIGSDALNSEAQANLAGGREIQVVMGIVSLFAALMLMRLFRQKYQFLHQLRQKS
jgi:uncharacterized protein